MSRRVVAAKIFLYLVLFNSITACSVIPLPGISGISIVTDAVLAKDFKPDTGAPVDVTTEYAPEQNNFLLIVTVNDAPKDTKFKSVWTAVEIGGTTAPNTKLEERELIVTGSGTFEFSVTPKTGRWASGKYKVDLYTNNRLDRTLSFTVAGAIAARVPSPTPTIVQCSVPTNPPIKPSGLITKVVMAEKIDAFGNPLNPTATFKSTTKIYAVISYKNVPANTRLRIRWWATDVGTAASCNTTLGDDEHKLEQTGTMALYLEKTKPFPVGAYRVEIFLNDKLDQVTSFSVKE